MIERTAKPAVTLTAGDGIGYLCAIEVRVRQLIKQQQLPVVRINRPGRFWKGLLDDWLSRFNNQTLKLMGYEDLTGEYLFS